MKFDPDELKEIGQRIRDARGERSQGWLAEKVKTKSSAISYIEKGVRPVPKDKIDLFARVLGMSTKDLIPEPAPKVEQELLALRDMGFAFRDLKVLPEEAKRELLDHYNDLKRKHLTGTLHATETPAELAARVLRDCGITRPPVDLSTILRKHQIVAEASTTVVSDGWIVYSKASKWAGIKYKKDMPPGRVRFTIAHELGHYFLRKDGEVEVSCSMDSSEESKEHEREANEFASNLLMPKAWISKALSESLSGMADVLRIANSFEVSRTAAARRIVELSEHPCAVIVSKQGRVDWWKTSSSLYLRSRKEKGIPKSSQAHRLLAGKSGGAARKADCAKWFEGSMPGAFWEESALIFEGIVLSLIWARNGKGGAVS